MPRNGYSIAQVREIVNSRGLHCALEVLRAEDIEDEQLRHFWANADLCITMIESILENHGSET
jgi:hypothetical protein